MLAVNRVANALLARGLRKGDRVALMLPSHPDHIVAIFALAKAGLVRVPVNVHLKGPALEFVFEQFAPQALIADRDYASQLKACSRSIHSTSSCGAAPRRRPAVGLTFAAHPDASPPPVAPRCRRHHRDHAELRDHRPAERRAEVRPHACAPVRSPRAC